MPTIRKIYFLFYFILFYFILFYYGKEKASEASAKQERAGSEPNEEKSLVFAPVSALFYPRVQPSKKNTRK